jgi:3-hydroxybutyryl-CoA dehydratase
MSQTMKFKGPVYIGDEVVATCKITAVDTEKARVALACDCSVNGKTVLAGEALMMVDRKAAGQ